MAVTFRKNRDSDGRSYKRLLREDCRSLVSRVEAAFDVRMSLRETRTQSGLAHGGRRP